jgi:hypothetical protein
MTHTTTYPEFPIISPQNNCANLISRIHHFFTNVSVPCVTNRRTSHHLVWLVAGGDKARIVRTSTHTPAPKQRFAMSGSPIAYSVSRKRKRTQFDDRSPSHKSAKHSFGAAASSSGANSRPTAPIRQDRELGDQVRTDCGAFYDGDIERRADELRHVEARQNKEPQASNNTGAFIISPALRLEIPFQLFTHPPQQLRLSTASSSIEAYRTTPPTTPSRPLRSPHALAIWAGIVGVPPPLPNFGQPTSVAHLPPADPICLLSVPNLDHIWNSLPTGTFWEFARFAQDENFDANDLSEAMVLTVLIGDTRTRKRSNVEGVEAIRSWDNGSTLSEEDTHWLQELDWEAEAIMEDKGRMLGIGVDGDMGDNNGTRYGGRVGFCATLHYEERQRSAPLNLKVDGRIVLEKPMMRGSCLFTRVWGSHRFLRLKLSERLLNRISKDETGQLRKDLQDYCNRPIHILGRKYHPLVEKEGTVFYFQHGYDHVGLIAIEDLGGTRKYGVGRHIGTVEGLLQWWLVPEHNRHQAMSKLMTRLHLGLSDTLPGVFVKPENVEIAPDISTNLLYLVLYLQLTFTNSTQWLQFYRWCWVDICVRCNSVLPQISPRGQFNSCSHSNPL